MPISGGSGMTPASVWDYLTTSMLAAGSIGKLLVAGAFVPYSLHDQMLAAGATFVPPANTLIFSAEMATVAQKLDIMYSADVVRSGTEMGATEQGYIGGTYFDGTLYRYMNTDVAQRSLCLDGVSL